MRARVIERAPVTPMCEGCGRRLTFDEYESGLGKGRAWDLCDGCREYVCVGCRSALAERKGGVCENCAEGE